MLVKKKVTTVEEVEVEIKLPAYFKESMYDYYYAITDEGVLRVSNTLMTLTKAGSMRFAAEVSQVSAYEVSNEVEFMTAYDSARQSLKFRLPIENDLP